MFQAQQPTNKKKKRFLFLSKYIPETFLNLVMA